MDINKKNGKFKLRLKRLGIEAEFSANYPWVYLESINGRRIDEKYYSDYGFTLLLVPVKSSTDVEYLNIRKTFEIIRKYID